MSKHIPEAAIKGYFFDKGFKDFRSVITGTKNTINREFKKQLSNVKLSKDIVVCFKSLFKIVAALSMISFGLLFFVFITVVHATVLSLVFSLFYALFSLIWLCEHLVLSIKGFFVACPVCYQKYPLPIYICPSCKRWHHNLAPSVYGTFHHECVCGEKLPSTIWNGRSKLQAICPHNGCNVPLKAEHLESKKIEMPVWGGVSVGKTAFLYAAVNYILKSSQQEGKSPAMILDKNTELTYQTVCDNLDKGNAPVKTAEGLPRAFEILRTNKKQLIKLYDPAGEIYQSNKDLEKHHYLERLSGAFLIIDPFSFPDLRHHYQRELASMWKSIKPGNNETESLVEKIILSLDQDFDARKNSKFDFPLAVIVNKTDLFNLHEMFDKTQVLKKMQKGESFEVARNRVIKQKIIDWGGRSLIQKLEVQFSNLQFFSCAAMAPKEKEGKITSFNAVNVDVPIDWILKENNVELK